MGIKEEVKEEYLISIVRFVINYYAKNNNKGNYSRIRLEEDFKRESQFFYIKFWTHNTWCSSITRIEKITRFRFGNYIPITL